MRRISAAVILSAALLAPQAIAQTPSSPGTKLAECGLALRDAMAASMKYAVTKREKDAESGDITVVLQTPGLVVFGQPALGLNVTRSTDPASTGFVTKVALDYPQIRSILPKAFGKTRCSAEGTAITYCRMSLADDISAGRHRVTMFAEPADGGGTMLTCLYEKLEG
ncbi:MAG: hypothetical protein EOP60_09075 [Sphingomonadales bacterium]|nr:MAG: hypothetical protein EOP60_09075 [Sphingomonadales bacterium]